VHLSQLLIGADSLTIKTECFTICFSFNLEIAMQSGVRLKATLSIGRPITWAQLNLEAAEDLRGLMRRNRWAAELMLSLIQKMEPGSGGVVLISRETMRELLGCSMPTVDRALKTIITEGWAQRIKVGGASALAINHRVAWVGPRGDIQHAVFGATVIASRSEQDALSLSPPPMRPIPMLRSGEIPEMTGPGLDPPSQPDLDGIPPCVATTPAPDVDADGVISDRRIRELETLP
jgi:hypothetical protein